jgi:precorrin-3B C17-methyltransferase
MHKQDKGQEGGDSSGKGGIKIVGIGPGGQDHLTGAALDAIGASDCVVGYSAYIDLIRPLLGGKRIISTGMTEEVRRCEAAIEEALRGRVISIVSSGDSGIYGMAGVVLELATKRGLVRDMLDIEVIPGVPAFVAAASVLGAPIMHDFASISLSDILTPWEKIEKRVNNAGSADFVIILYNPKSSKRVEGLGKAIDILRGYRSKATPVGIVRNAMRQGQRSVLTTLGDFDGFSASIDMLTIVVIGNSETFIKDGLMITPRGYGI